MPTLTKKTRTPKEPNIAFTGEKDGFKPVTQINNGENQVIKLPKNQKKPFYHKDAKTILRMFGYLYKPVTAKG